MKIVKILSIMIGILFIISTNQLVSSDSWPMFFHNPQHTGNSTSTAPNTNTTLWSVPNIGGNGYSSPTVANGRVFINQGSRIYCLFENNGTEIWNQSIQPAGQACSTPTASNGKVYVVGSKVYCFYENNGTGIWNKSIGGIPGTSSPTVTEGKLYIYTGTLYCFYASNGTEIWNESIGGSGESTPAVSNGKVFINAGNLYCFYTNNGTEIWNITGGGMGNSPAVSNGKVFYNPGIIMCLYESNGTEIWSQAYGGDGYSSPAIANGKVFVNVNGVIYCYYANNGTEKWNIPLTGDGCSTPAISSDGKVIVNSGGYTYCLNESSGAEIWSYATGGEGFSSPAVANGRVFVNLGTVICFGGPLQTIDYIIIRDESDGEGSIVTTGTYSVWETDQFYAGGYNDSTGYVQDVEVEWSSDNVSIGQVDSPGTWTIFTAQWVPFDDVCTVTATYQGIIVNSTGLFTVLAPTVDYIQIRDAQGGGGSVVTTRTYSTLEVDEFYAAAYNNTVSYLYDVEVEWESDDTNVGRVDSPGIWTNFTALILQKNSNCTVHATYGPGISNSTGILTVRVVLDFILIRDNPWALGDEVIWILINGSETKTYWVAGYNKTAGAFMGIVLVNWSITGDIGTIDTPRGYSTNFTAPSTPGVSTTGTFTVVYEGLSPITVGVTVNLLPSAPTDVRIYKRSVGESLVLRWTASPESDVAGYIIYRSNTSASNFLEAANIIGAANTYYLDTGLTDNTTYYYYIVAYDDGPNYSPASNMVSCVSDKDTDLDEIYNLEDNDDDDDGLLDTEEIELGLDPLLEDTDGDGHNDKDDYYPLDKDRWEKPGDLSLLLILVLIIIVVVVLILIFFLFKRRKKS